MSGKVSGRRGRGGRSKNPKNTPPKTPECVEGTVVKIRTKMSYGPDHLRDTLLKVEGGMPAGVDDSEDSEEKEADGEE